MVTSGLKRLHVSVSDVATWIYTVILIMKSRVMGDYQARFCERFRGEIPLYLLDLLVRILIATTLVLLYRWALHCPVAAINTAVPVFRFYNCFAILTLIEILAGVRWHFFLFLVSAVWTGND